MAKQYRVYFDVCCLNRPLDNALQERIRLEAEAVLLIYRKCRIGEWQLVSSEVVDLEIAKTQNQQRLRQLQMAVSIPRTQVRLDAAIQQRTIALNQLGFKPFDAAHLASAESGGADVFLTTDDRLLKRAKQYRGQLNVTVKNPVNWFIEISQLTGGPSDDDTP